jgi:hypothetical protein
MREAIYRRLDWMWERSGYKDSRWRTVKESILEFGCGVDISSKSGRKSVNELTLGTPESRALLDKLSDGDLLDLYELTTRQFYTQR